MRTAGAIVVVGRHCSLPVRTSNPAWWSAHRRLPALALSSIRAFATDTSPPPPLKPPVWRPPVDNSSASSGSMSRPPSGPPPMAVPPPGPPGTTPNPKPPVPQQYQVKPPSTQYFPPASAYGAGMPPGTPFQGQNTQTYLPSQAFTPTSFGAGWQGSVLSTFGADGPPTGDSARMQTAESLAPPGWDTSRQIAALQVKLDRQLGPEFVSQRAGMGGAKFTYIEGWKLINIANEIFGFNGWSSSILALDTDFIDTDSQGRHTVGVTARVRVTLRDGAYHEDCGYGSMSNSRDKAAALEKCKKEAVTDALKRALRSFGNVLGNCLYDKTYESKIKTVKAYPAKFDEKQLYRRPEFDTYNSRAGIITDPTGPVPTSKGATGLSDPFDSQASTSGGGATGSPGPKSWQVNGGGGGGGSSLARTALANATATGSNLQQRSATTMAPPQVVRAQASPSRPASEQQLQRMESLSSSSPPQGVNDMDLSAVDLDASAYDAYEGINDDGAAGMHSAPVAAPSAAVPQRQQQQQQATTRPTNAPQGGPPPLKQSGPSSLTSNPGAAARAASIASASSSKVGGFSFPGADQPQPHADGPPRSVNPGAWKRQQSVMNLNRASAGRPLSTELESVQSASGSAPKRQKVEYGGQQV